MRAFTRSTLSVTILISGLLLAGCGETGTPSPLLASIVPSTQPTAFRIAPIFTSNMVLQREMPLPVFGWARPGDEITVKFLDQKRDTVADEKGRWVVTLDPLSAGGPYVLTATGHEMGAPRVLTLTNVLVGEVWVCSGQSNMELLVSSCTNSKQEIAAGDHSTIRLNSSSASFVKATGRDWVECSPKNVGNCSAVGYYFGRELQKDLNVPVGLVVRAVGGTVIKQWAPKSGELVEKDPELSALNEDWKRAAITYADSKKVYSSWQATTRSSKTGTTLAMSPPAPLDPNRYGGMYDGQIAPLMPFAVRGVIWYQGETDARNGREDDQRTTLPLMVKAWRKAWGEGDFPFLLVQLANDWGGNGVNKAPELPTIPPENQHWPWVREAQAAVCKLLPNTAMACTIDLGGKIHFPGKLDVARRLAHVAEAQVYHLSVPAAGPLYASMEIETNAIRIRFAAPAGLVTRDNGTLQGFAIAGADRKFVWADARIDGDSVVVSSKAVAQPLAVRYDWLNDPHGNLYSTQGLPTAPFRTDDWPRFSTDGHIAEILTKSEFKPHNQ